MSDVIRCQMIFCCDDSNRKNTIFCCEVACPQELNGDKSKEVLIRPN